jgi:hypothetical protein
MTRRVFFLGLIAYGLLTGLFYRIINLIDRVGWTDAASHLTPLLRSQKDGCGCRLGSRNHVARRLVLAAKTVVQDQEIARRESAWYAPGRKIGARKCGRAVGGNVIAVAHPVARAIA